MKKLVSLMMALMMACALTLSLAETADLSGQWYLTEMVMDGNSLPTAAMGMKMTIALNTDGTAVVSTDYGDQLEEVMGEWKLGDGVVTVTMDGEPADLTIGEGTLEMDMGSGILVFKREAGEAPAMPTPVAAESRDAFLGAWTLTQVGVGGSLLPAAAMGISVTLEISADAVVMTSEGEAAQCTAEMAEGALKIITQDGEEMLMELNDNGWASITEQYGEDTVMSMYFERTAE